MMRKIAVLIFLLIPCIFLFFVSDSFAVEEQTDFWEEFKNALPDGVFSDKDTEEILSGVGIDSLLAELISASADGVRSVLSFLLMLIGISALLSLSQTNLFSVNEKNSEHVAMAISLISSLLIFYELKMPVQSVSVAIKSISSFFNSVSPVFTAILLAGGNSMSAAAQTVNLNITYSAVSIVSTEILLPLVSSLFAFSLLSGIGDSAVGSLSKGVRSFFNWVLGIVTTVIVAASAMQSVVATAKDSAYLRAAKFAASGMIPVVGGSVSGALGTLAGGLSYVKSTLGIASVLVIISVSLSPLVTLLLYRLAFSIAISFLEFTSCTGGVRVFSAFRSSIDALISVYCVSSLLYVFQIVLFIKGGAEIFA